MLTRWVVVLPFFGCLPSQPTTVVLPDRVELVKGAPRFAVPAPEQCTVDHMAEYLVWYDDDMANKSGCYGTLNAVVYCLQLYPCLEQRVRCEHDLERLDRCINDGLERYSSRQSRSP